VIEGDAIEVEPAKNDIGARGKAEAGGAKAEAKSAQGEPRLGFEFLDGPVTPRPEKIPRPPAPGAKPKRKPPSARRHKPSGPRGGGGQHGGDGGDDTPPRRGSVPKVPLVKV